MKFLGQIKMEILNILRSRFLLVICILVASVSVIIPVINYFTQTTVIEHGGGAVRPLPMPVDAVYYSKAAALDIDIFPPDMGQEPIVVDGIRIEADNPFYWQIKGMQQEMEAMETDKNRFSEPEVLDLVLSIMEEEIKLYVNFAKNIVKPTDYRVELAWRSMQYVHDKFIYEHNDVPEDKLLEAVMYRMGVDPENFKKKYIDITPEEKLAALDQLEDKLNTLYSIVENNDFPKYIEWRIQLEHENIANMEEQIAIHEQAIIENPSQEDSLNEIIENLKRQIDLIKTNTIPILELRLERNIIPGEDIWQNSALSDIENSRNQISWTEIVPEEEFFKNTWLVQQYGTYQKYVNAMQSQIDELNKTILIAQNSLDANEPDMKYVPGGSRNRTVSFLDYSVFVALLAVLLGGWLMASEFQQGTIRLLLIRPKTRVKILMAKFISALLICLGIYITGSILNLVTNGICFGFSDYTYPNYTVSGQINFFAYYFPKMFACIITILFSYSVAFMLSVVVKIAAVAIAVPIAAFIGSSIMMSIFTYSRSMNWIAYTPIPYVQISSFFVPYSIVQHIIQRGIPLNLTYGIIMLLAISILCIAASVFVFKTRDITN